MEKTRKRAKDKTKRIFTPIKNIGWKILRFRLQESQSDSCLDYDFTLEKCRSSIFQHGYLLAFMQIRRWNCLHRENARKAFFPDNYPNNKIHMAMLYQTIFD